jgi:hypothetical protein
VGLLAIKDIISYGGAVGQVRLTNFETKCYRILAKVRNGNHLL